MCLSERDNQKGFRQLLKSTKGARQNMNCDKETGMLRLDRVLFSSVNYPENYGFIPQTLGKDHDPLDILVLSEIEVQPLCIVEAKVVGVMRMIDNNEADDKIIAVALNDMSVNHINDVSELPANFMLQLQNFFEDYKKLENKEVKVEEFHDAETAKQIIQQAIKDYQQEFKH